MGVKVDGNFGGKGGDELPAPSDPMGVARILVRDHQQDHAGELTLRHWRGEWMQWQDTYWAAMEDRAIRSWLYACLENAKYWHVTNDGSELRPWNPNRHKVGDVLEALAAVVHTYDWIDPPTWLSVSKGPRSQGNCPAREIVACSNGLLHVGSRELLELSPLFFNEVAVPFAYDSAAPQPVKWLEFLNQLWPGDDESIAALQEFFGYILSGRTDLHKIILLIGPSRSGKGTIARVLAALLGKGNVAGPTLASLGTNFGLAPLIGKPLAVVSDARLGNGRDVHQVVERLLSISGEDYLTIDRKYRQPWTGKLPSRFLILSNELPRFGDASGAIGNRCVILQMTNSFLGKENASLTDELIAELPGILSWSLEGLDRLTQQGRFTEPQSSIDAVLSLADLVSPCSAFVRDCCERGVGYEVSVAALFNVWRYWCDVNGHRAGSVQTFSRDLRAVIPTLRTSRPRTHGGRERHFRGVRLNTDHDGADRGPSWTTGPNSGSNPGSGPHGPQSDPLWSSSQNGRSSGWAACSDCGQRFFATDGQDDLCKVCDQGAVS
jgi:putative DNA primase/helicase